MVDNVVSGLSLHSYGYGSAKDEPQKECPDIASEPKPCLNLTYQKVYEGYENRRSQTENLTQIKQ